MKEKILVAVLIIVIVISASGIAPYVIAKDKANAEGAVKTFQLCFFDRGPFWLYGNKTPVYYVTYESGRTAYIAVTLFGTEIKFNE